jgi:hypothetical protein
MSNLLNTNDGFNAMLTAQRFLLERRLSRFFKRNLVVCYNDWLAGNGFHLSKLLGELNSVHDTEVINLYRLLQLVGGMPATISDMDIYVDAANGSDETGDGTAAKPYKTLWFYETLPQTIRHEVNILFTSDFVVDNYEPFDVVFDFEHDGYLNFVGVGEPEILEGPFTVAAIGTIASGAGRYIQMTGAVGNHPGEFLLAADGASAGNAQPIHSRYSTDTYLTLTGAFGAMGLGDTLNVVRPSVQFQCASLSVNCRNDEWYSNIVRRNGKVAFVNLKLRIANSNDARDSLLVDNSMPMAFSFVQLDPPDNGSYTIKSPVNTRSCISSAEALSLSGVANIAHYGTELGQNFAGMAVKDTGKNYFGNLNQGDLRWWCSRGLINLEKDCAINHVSCERLTAYLSSSSISNTIAEGRANAGAGGGLESYHSLIDIDKFTVLDSDNILVVTGQSVITVKNADYDGTYSTITGYGIYFVAGGTVELHDAAASLSGTTGDIRYVLVNPAVTAAIPAAYGIDSQQTATVKRLGV